MAPFDNILELFPDFTSLDNLRSLPVTWYELCLILWFSYVFTKGIYRLYFHPLAGFPGPAIAGLTYWYEMYYDIILEGQYLRRIKEMHRIYGPIVRISPEEIHISDPDFYNAVFAPSPDAKTGAAPKRHKWIRFVQVFGHPDQSAFGTTNHDVHKMRRGAMDRFFSPGMLRKFSPVLIEDKVETLCRRLKEEGEKGPVRFKLACSCYTTDVISDYATGHSFDYLNHPNFFPEWSDVFLNISKAGLLLKPWPFLFKLLDNIPEWLAKRMDSGMSAVVISKRESKEIIQGIKEGKEAGTFKSGSHPSIFEELLDSDLPPEEKSVERLQGDGQAIIGAGTETTASTMASGIVRILSNPDILAKLKEELEDAIPNPNEMPSLSALQKLPYLTAVIKESLRLGFGVVGRCQRISDLPLQYKQWTIPPDTPIGMSAGLIHVDPSVWDNPKKFNPERWTDPSEAARLTKYLVSFSKGPRMCIGINIAYAELYLGLAALFRKFDMSLFETTEDDVEGMKSSSDSKIGALTEYSCGGLFLTLI
ncbi:cytochrome P450 [Patellaria atrata CBS 101060]|uniref:Cytochrome P450 n=1 Tax=Patellaria atrata CBS 101060 TaxID=1346257 RepID=A0A9P4S2J1_9PEZI|nr:cytochrome P450 [Patellaria atrata CBS 101060]